VALVVRASSLHTLGQAGRLHHNQAYGSPIGPERGHMRLPCPTRAKPGPGAAKPQPV